MSFFLPPTAITVSNGGTGLSEVGSTGQVLGVNPQGKLAYISIPGSAGGTVTSVALAAPALFTISNSPVTASGTLTLGYAGGQSLPVTSGGTGLIAVGAPGQVLTTNLGGTAIVWATPASPGVGTVTSVSLAAPSLFTVTNSPVTASGTLTLAYTSGQSLPVTSGGTGLIAVGAPGQVLTTNGPGTAIQWSTPTSGTVTSVGLNAPSFLAASSAITSSGLITLSYNTGVPLPFANGGTGLTTVGTLNQVLTSNGTTPVWGSTISSLVGSNGATFNYDPILVTATVGIQIGRADYGAGPSNQMLMRITGVDEGLLRVGCSEANGDCALNVGIFGNWTFGNALTARFMDHQNKTRILRDGFSAGNFTANHPFQIQCTSGGARAIQMGYQDSTDTGYIQSMDFLNNLKPLLIRSSATTMVGDVTLSTPLGTGSGGIGLNTVGADGFVLTVVGGAPSWQPAPTVTSTFSAITVSNGAFFTFSPTIVTTTAGVQIGQADYGAGPSNQMLMRITGVDDGLLRVGCSEANGDCSLYVGIFGNWTFGNTLTARFMDHQNKTRILRDGFSAGNFTANHPFQIQCTSGGARAIQMGFDPVTESSYIQSMDFLNNLKPLLIRSSALTLSSALPTNSGGTGISTDGAAGQVLTTVTPGVLAWLAVPAITNNFTAITVDSGATFAGGADASFPNTDGVFIGKLLGGLQSKIKTVGTIARNELRETSSGKTFTISAGSLLAPFNASMRVTDDSFNFFPIYTTSPIHIVRTSDSTTRDLNNISHALELRTAETDGSALLAGFDVNNDIGYITCGNPLAAKDLVLNSAGGNVVVKNDLSSGNLTIGTTSSAKNVVVNSSGSRLNDENVPHPIRINAPFSTASLQMGVNAVTLEGYVQVTGDNATRPMYVNYRNDGKTICSNVISKSLGLSGRYLAYMNTAPNGQAATYDMDWYIFGSLCFIRMSGVANPNTGVGGDVRTLRLKLPFDALNETQSCGGTSMQYDFQNISNPIEASILKNDNGVLAFKSAGGLTFDADVTISALTQERSCSGVSFVYKINPAIDTTIITGPTNPESP